ncbi:MAG: hypothetical protein ACSHYC_22090 [Alphaproteobacteria bacterium]
MINKKLASLIAALFIVLSSPVFAKEITVIEQDIDGYIYHEINDCPDIRGAGLVVYGRISQGNATVELSDFCFDPQTGTLIGSETVPGLQLVAKNAHGETYENLSLGLEQDDRPSLHTGLTSDGKSACNETPDDNKRFIFDLGKNETISTGVDGGYFYDEVSNPQTNVEYDEGFIAAYIYKIDGRAPRKLKDSKFHNVFFYTKLVFTEDSGELTLLPSGDAGVRNESGSIDITVVNGGHLRGSGYAHIENGRLAGHTANEWLSADVQFVQLHGHVTGPDSRIVTMRGWAVGTMVDAQKVTHDIKGYVIFDGCISVGSVGQ